MHGIKGIPVVLYERTVSGSDPFGNPITTETMVIVDNVLVSPTSAEDIVNETQVYGKHSVYTLCIPKGDTHNWEDARVEFFGKTFKVFGDAIEYQEELLPLAWNKQIKVERYV